MAITASMVKDLRTKTGAGMMDCKKALAANGWRYGKSNRLPSRKKAWQPLLKKQTASQAEGLVYSYIHGNGRIGVLVEINCETDFVAQTDNFKDLCKDIAMQIAAANPAYLKREDVPEDVLEHEKEVLRQQALNEGKPEKIVEKMIVGRIEKFYKENCLLDQEFIKDSDKTIQQVITENIAKIGEKIDIRRYTRYELGEGLQKRNDDFVSEVMAQAK